MGLKETLYEKYLYLISRIKKVKKRTIYCVIIGFLFSFLSFFLNKKSIYIRPNEILRNSYGTEKTPYNIKLDAINLKKNMEFQVTVSSKKYLKEEADIKFKEKLEELKINILNENIDFEHINSKLNFSNDLGDGIKASYTFVPSFKKNIEEIKLKISSNSNINNIASISEATKSVIEAVDEFKYYVKYQNLIDGSGNIKNDNFKIDEKCLGFIEVVLSTEVKDLEGSYKSEKFMFPITIISKELTTIESFKNAFKNEFISKDNDSIEKNTIKLPQVVNNFKIKYKDNIDYSFVFIFLIGILVAILFEAKDKEKIIELKKEKQRSLEMDFVQIISKILIYVSSGMTIRNSMIRLAEQYNVKLKNNQIKRRTAYDELVIVRNKLVAGYGEIKAYEEMAEHINMRIYTRFLNIIIQSIKNGNKDIKNILNMEVQDALYGRKQKAKTLGEEAATKLVLPLMMMLAIIMVVIMVPAFMGI